MSDIYSYSVELPKRSIPLADYKSKSILFVNVASKCGLTPQYKDLQALQDKHADTLQIIGFPSNQFKAQEPGTDDEILNFCQVNYGVTFPIAKKGDVNGPDTQPIWKALKKDAGVDEIDWNFSKFLLTPDGKLTWFPARTTKVADVEAKL
ncbi:Glutathione peroxidase-like peroxiredoxin HYR1 [Vanrija pseudolonga]|uniref:Glutathione peroxidase n=1 Tax=Vanrija pseudolonga TaxID=143232 RepID=A0AAF0Y748_9TREE|nr:Glutathione peroxidase-like peroxiredoxin HYR1 [Vanrija pseudolonga]